MKLMHVIRANIIHSCQTFMYFINLLHNYVFFEKYIRIKIEDHKILVLISKVSPKSDEVNASYLQKYNLILSDFHIFSCISSIYHIIMHFFKKYVRIKIEDHKILVPKSTLSLKSDEVNTSYQLLTAVDVRLLIVFLPG